MSETDPFAVQMEDAGEDNTPDDFFDGMETMGGPRISNDEPVEEAPPQGEGRPPEESHWQSKHDLAQAEVERLKRENETYRMYDPYLRALSENPQVLAQLSSGQTQQPPAGGGRVDSLKEPEMPKRPAGYDHTEAMHDPDSESYAYLQSLVGYQEDVAKYNAGLAAHQRERIQADIAQQEEASRMAMIQRSLATDYGMNQNEITDFVSLMNNPDSFNVENLVRLYRSLKAPNLAQEQGRQKAQAFQRTGDIPIPAANAPGENEPTDPGKSVADSVIDYYKQSNPFD